MTVSTLQGDDYIVTTFHSDDMFSLMTSFQIGLRRRSKYAIAVQDASHFGKFASFFLDMVITNVNFLFKTIIFVLYGVSYSLHF